MALQKITDITRVCNQTNISEKVDCLALLKADYLIVQQYNQSLLDSTTANAGNATLAAVQYSLANPVLKGFGAAPTFNYAGYTGLSLATMQQNLDDVIKANTEAKNQVRAAKAQIDGIDIQIASLKNSPTFASEQAAATSKKQNYRIALIAGIIIVVAIIGFFLYKKYRK